MKLRIAKKDLLTGLNKIYGVVEKKHPQAIYQNVFLSVDDHRLTLIGCDTQAQIKTFVPCIEVTEKSQITVSCQKIMDIVKSLPEGFVDLHLENNILKIMMDEGDISFSLTSNADEEYPSIEFNEEHISMRAKIDEQVLSTMLEKTAFTIGMRNAREYINATLFHFQKDKLSVVTSDSHRLSIIESTIDNATDSKYIVPRKSVFELIKLLNPQSKEQINIEFTDSLICIVTESFEFISTLINAQYPDYTTVIPNVDDSIDGKFTVDKTELKDCCNRVGILTSLAYRVALFNFKGKELTLSGKNSFNEKAEESIQLDETSNLEGAEIGYNITFFIEAIDFCEGNVDVVIIHKDENDKRHGHTAVFVFENELCKGKTLVLPINIQNI